MKMVDEIISDEVVSYIRDKMQKIRYGKIIIELQENADKVDVITETRQRFQKKQEKTE
jgi:hypothetical protein